MSVRPLYPVFINEDGLPRWETGAIAWGDRNHVELHPKQRYLGELQVHVRIDSRAYEAQVRSAANLMFELRLTYLVEQSIWQLHSGIEMEL